VALAGCSSTTKKQKEAELAAVTSAVEVSRDLLGKLRDGKIPPQHDIHLYIAHEVVNKALTALDGYRFLLPNDNSIEVEIRGVRLANAGAVPTVAVDAKAIKGGLQAEVQLTASLVPVDPVKEPGKFSIQVLSFTPRLSGFWFEVTKFRFSQALLAGQLNAIAENLPLIELPITQAIQLGGPAITRDVRVKTSDHPSYLTLRVSIPSTERILQLKVVSYVFLQDGVHAFGVVE
jgi:hypothetical protein